MNRTDRSLVWLLLAYTAMLAIMPLVMSHDAFHWTFSEEGPFEQLSIVGWLVAAATVLLRIRPLGTRAWSFALLCMAFAAREADWHKLFTGESFLKNSFYRDAARPFEEKLICGIIALCLVALVLYAGVVIARFLFLQGGWRSRSGAWLLAGTVLVVVGKVIDRLPAVLSVNYGIELGTMMKLYAEAFEEGLEMAHPLILAWSVWISQNGRRFLS